MLLVSAVIASDNVLICVSRLSIGLVRSAGAGAGACSGAGFGFASVAAALIAPRIVGLPITFLNVLKTYHAHP